MSALGDIALEGREVGDPLLGRINNVSIPLLIVHAFDDPLITWQTVAANQGHMHPDTLTKTGSGNLFLLLTKRGGHVGWPLGNLPYIDSWRWMNDNAKCFAHAVQQARDNSLDP
jgi:predicted alpha/beta-fold hydrolase